MTITKEQAQMLASLAIDCRPHRAPTWDHAGVLANIAKVRDRGLAEVVMAVIRAANDAKSLSPGVIPTAGPHWQEKLTEPKWQPESIDPAERCSVCSHRRDKCRSLWADDHEFESAVEAARNKTGRPVAAVEAIVDDLRERVAEDVTPTPEPREKPQPADPRAEAARAAIRAADTDPTDTEDVA